MVVTFADHMVQIPSIIKLSVVHSIVSHSCRVCNNPQEDGPCKYS